MQQTVKDYFPNVNLRVAFKAPATLKSQFLYKDKDKVIRKNGDGTVTGTKTLASLYCPTVFFFMQYCILSAHK